MKKILLLFLATILLCTLPACGKGIANADSDAGKPAETATNTDSGSDTDIEERISFDDSDSDTTTYKEHVADLWEQTKTVMKEDLGAGYSDQEYQERGNALEIIWTDLQVHSSLDHKAEADVADEDTDYANLIGHIKDLINKAYGNWGVGTAEEREEKRDSLRDGGLERKFEDLDEVVYSEA